MSVLKNFKNIPRSPYGGQHVLNVIFFFKFATRSLTGGGARAGGLTPPPGRPGGPTHRRDRGACRSPPRATGPSPYI